MKNIMLNSKKKLKKMIESTILLSYLQDIETNVVDEWSTT